MGVEGTGPVDQRALDAVQTGQKRKKDGRSSESVETKEKISLQEVVTHMSENETQKEVTFPFYFICLLHLANEHVSIIIPICDYFELYFTCNFFNFLFLFFFH